MKPARIIVLLIAVVAGGVAAFLASGSDPQRDKAAPAPTAKLDVVDVLVAGADIKLGQTVTAADLRWQQWPREAATGNYIRKSDRPDAIKSLSGSIARVPFSAGEPIRETKLVKAEGSGYMAAILPSGMRAVSTEISPETGAGGFILPNDRVDVILSRRNPEAEKAAGVEVHTSETILRNVRVLAIDQTVEEQNGQRVVVGKTATLELTPRQAETLTLARQLGTLSLALRSLADSQSDKPEAEDDSRHTGINIVRFGITSMTTPR